MDHSKQKIGIDCLALPRYFAGAAYYIYYLTLELLKQPRTYRIAVFCKPKHIDLFKSHLCIGDQIIPIPINNRIQQLVTYEYKLKSKIKDEDVDLFHAMHYITPPGDPSYQIVNTIHDMGFVLHPRYYPLIKRLYFNLRMKRFMERADKLIAISRSTADDIRRYYPEQNNKIETIYPGTDHLKQKVPAMALQNSNTQFALCVNSFEKRKNFPFIIEVYNQLKRRYNVPHQLLLIGPAANGYQELIKAINRSPYKDHITIRKNVSLQNMKGLYQQADFFISASFYEGFGFTPFEAASMDCPAFLLRNNITNEIFGDHPYIFKHKDAQKWAKCIFEEMRHRFKNKIPAERVAPLTWENTAQKVCALHHQLLEERKSAHV